MQLADSLEDLTPEWFTEALRESPAVGEVTVTGAEASLFGTGQFGLVARAELTYAGDAGDAPASVIVKLPSTDPGSRQLGVAIGAYEAEVRFYDEIAPRTDVTVPNSYWGGFEPGTGRVTLVLEDLSEHWTVGDAIAGGTLEQAEAAIDQTVRLQASLWDVAELRDLDWLSSPARTQLLFDGTPAAMPLFAERFGERLDPVHMAAAERLGPKASTFPAKAWAGTPLVVAHGDYRLDNLLFAGGAATVIDWQSVLLAPPGIDLGIYLASCLPTEVRRSNQDALLHRYHDGLLERGVEGFSFDDCVESLRVCCLYVFLLGIGVSVTLEQTERGDQMFAALITQSAELVDDLGAASYLD